MICQSCGVHADTRPVEFRQNIGMLFMRKHRKVQGNLCRACINKYFWEFTGVTLVLGWWGTISFFVSWWILFTNLLNYVQTLGMASVPYGAARSGLTKTDLEMIAPYTEEIVRRLKDGQSYNRIAKELSPQIGVMPGQVVEFIRIAAGVSAPSYPASQPTSGMKWWWPLVALGFAGVLVLGLWILASLLL
jgi:hypothetical protein